MSYVLRLPDGSRLLTGQWVWVAPDAWRAGDAEHLFETLADAVLAAASYGPRAEQMLVVPVEALPEQEVSWT
jgi:hypothetical protein